LFLFGKPAPITNDWPRLHDILKGWQHTIQGFYRKHAPGIAPARPISAAVVAEQLGVPGAVSILVQWQGTIISQLRPIRGLAPATPKTPKEIIQSLQKKGINGMCITDHNTIKGSIEALKIAPKNFIVIPGVEISTLDGHILALNIVKKILPKQTIEITIEKIIDEGGIPIIPHVYRKKSQARWNT